LKDIGLTILGAFAIESQIRSPHPNGLVIGAGLALTVPDVARKVRALLPGPGDGEPSEPEPPTSGSPSESSRREVSGGK
jgi:hypothetical protein